MFADLLIPGHNLMYDAELALWLLSVMPPEYFSSKLSNEACTVWQFGCLLFYALVHKWPFMPSEKSKDKIPVSLIRRNIMLQRYEKYQDKTIQHELFDKIFCDQK